MCAQHYWEAPWCSLVGYPSGYYNAGILLDGNPTSYPLYMNRYFDSYTYGHVRAHLVEDPENGVITAKDGSTNIVVGGRCVGYARNGSIIATSSDQGYIIYDISPDKVRIIYIGGQYGMWFMKGMSATLVIDRSNRSYVVQNVNVLSIGDRDQSKYWWCSRKNGSVEQSQAWCASFDGIYADIMRDGNPINANTYPYYFYNGQVGEIWATSTCNVLKPAYSFKPQGAENDWLELALDFGAPDGRRVRRYLADSYVAAASQLPSAAANTLQNMLELGSLISNLVHGNFSSLKDFTNLKNLWLAYRYSYTTTKLDISDYRNVTNRLLALSSIPNITTHGISVFDNYRVRTSIEVTADEVIPHDAKTFMSAFNAKLSMVNTWDMIPWSFVVDWFFHVGDVLERLEKCASAYNLNPVSCWSSIERIGGKFYLRFPYAYSGGASVFQDFSCSNKTFIMRIADAICLFSR